MCDSVIMKDKEPDGHQSEQDVTKRDGKFSLILFLLCSQTSNTLLWINYITLKDGYYNLTPGLCMSGIFTVWSWNSSQQKSVTEDLDLYINNSWS